MRWYCFFTSRIASKAPRLSNLFRGGGGVQADRKPACRAGRGRSLSDPRHRAHGLERRREAPLPPHGRRNASRQADRARRAGRVHRHRDAEARGAERRL